MSLPLLPPAIAEAYSPIALLLLGLLCFGLGTMMALRPKQWGSAMRSFAEHKHFHLLEISSRLLLGLILIAVAPYSRAATALLALGCLLLLVALGLVLAGAERHRAFARRAATFCFLFRPGGLAAMLAGGWLIYSVWPLFCIGC